MTQPITLRPRTVAVYSAVRDHIAAHNRGPSYADISQATGIPHTKVSRHLAVLTEMGYLTRRGHSLTLGPRHWDAS
jgi:DNA-binding IclR family transcriptional regulator